MTRSHPFRLALSLLLLGLGLFSVWLALDAPLPTAWGICRRLAREHYVSAAPITASAPIHYQSQGRDVPRHAWWFVGRSGGLFQFYTMERLGGLLWRDIYPFQQLDLSEYGLSIYAMPMGEYLYGLGSEFVPVVVCTDPSVVRVEAQVLWLGNSEQGNPQAAINSRGISPEFTPVGDGVWASEPVIALFPPNGGSSALSIWCQGYDANGDLVCSFPDRSLE